MNEKTNKIRSMEEILSDVTTLPLAQKKKLRTQLDLQIQREGTTQSLGKNLDKNEQQANFWIQRTCDTLSNIVKYPGSDERFNENLVTFVKNIMRLKTYKDKLKTLLSNNDRYKNFLGLLDGTNIITIGDLWIKSTEDKWRTTYQVKFFSENAERKDLSSSWTEIKWKLSNYMHNMKIPTFIQDEQWDLKLK